MKTRPLAFALLLALAPAVTLSSRTAFAQAADDATTKMARQRFQEGVAYFDKGQFEMARAAFLQAYALHKHPVVLLNLAQSSLKSGHALEASRYFQEFLKEYGSSNETQRADANKGLAEARTRLGRIDVVGATTGADVFIDDERIGMAPLDHSVDVEPGSHSVRLQGSGADQSLQVIATAGQPTTARFSAAAAPPATSPTPAPAESPPAEPAPAPPEATPTPAPAPPPPSPTEEPSTGSHHWGWVVATGLVTVAGVTLAGVMAGEKSSAQTSANDEAETIVSFAASKNQNAQGVCYSPAGTPYAQPCATLTSDNNNVNADATIANVGIAIAVVGSIGLVISVVGTILSYGDEKSDAKPAASPSAFTVTPIFGKGVGGVGFGGSF